MREWSAADLYLARLAARPPYRRTIYTVFLLTAIASFWLRVVQGRADPSFPWFGALLCLYGFGMALMARDVRCRIVYAAFGLLVAAAFTRQGLAGWTRPIGVAETAASLVLLAAFFSLSRDERVRLQGSVLQSAAPDQRTNQEDSND